MLSLTSGKKITNEKVFKYQSAGDKTIEIVESAKLPQLAHHLRPIFGLVLLAEPDVFLRGNGASALFFLEKKLF